MALSKVTKTFIFSVLLIVSAVLFWHYLAKVYMGADLALGALLRLGISLTIFFVFLMLFSVLVEREIIAWLVYFLSLVGFFLFFPPKTRLAEGGKFHYYLLIGLAVLFLIFIISHFLMQRERQARLKFSLRPVTRRGLPLLLTFLALFMALVSYFYPLVDINKKGITIPPKVLNLILGPLSKSLGSALPFFDSSMTVDEMLSMAVVIEKPDLGALSPELLKKFQGKDLKSLNIQELLKDPATAEIFKKQAQKIDPRTLAQQRNELAKNLGFELKGSETVNDLINQLINSRLQSIIGPNIKFFPIISAVLTFVVLKIVFIPTSWLVLVISFLIFQFLLAFRVIRMEKVMKEGEDVIL